MEVRLNLKLALHMFNVKLPFSCHFMSCKLDSIIHVSTRSCQCVSEGTYCLDLFYTYASVHKRL